MANNEIPLETRIILMEREVDVLKLRDSDLKAWQESVNRSLYKMDSLEKSINTVIEANDDIINMVKTSQKREDNIEKLVSDRMKVVSDKIDDLNKKPEKTSWDRNIEKTLQIIFITLVLLAGFLGVKLPTGLGV